MIPNTVLKIGNQELIPLADHFRFSIKKTMPEKGFKFKFGIRERIIDEMISRATRLEVVFPERPEIAFNMNPIEWKAMGKRQKQVGLWKNNPFWLYWYYVDFRGKLVRKNEAQAEGQQPMFT